MRDDPHSWRSISSVAVAKNEILGGKDMGFAPSLGLLDSLCRPGVDSVLDFGCGLGRNFEGLLRHGCSVVGYDLPNMVRLAPDYLDRDTLCSVLLYDDWSIVRRMKFDVILAQLVLQHIPEHELSGFLEDFKSMSDYLCVHSRRRNDFFDIEVRDFILSFGWKIDRIFSAQMSLEDRGEDHEAILYRCKYD